MTATHNPYSGRRAPGFRFCFHVRAIAHRSIFLPLTMRQLPQIRRLLDGESPLSIFNCHTFREARDAFNDLRKRHDFAFWAATEYLIHDIDDADEIVSLRLNPYQHHMIDIMEHRRHNQQPSRYVISKSFGRCGLTTCVQAYMLWLQTYQCSNNSCTYSASESCLHPIKADLSRYLKRNMVFTGRRIYLPSVDAKAHFNTYRNPDAGRGINFGYVHFADMSKWRDPEGRLTSSAFRAAISGVLHEYFTLVVLEGNIPDPRRFPIDKYHRPDLQYRHRMRQLSHLSKNPAFLSYAALAESSSPDSHILHISLNSLPKRPV